MKYKNTKTKVSFQGTIYEFSSIAEANHFNMLSLLLKQGKISDLILQPTYELTKGFKINTNATKSGESKVSGMKYTPDFSYLQDGKQIVVEVKGKVTTDYAMRKKLFLSIAYEKYGVNEFVEVFVKNTFVYDCKSVVKN
ncbi:MAG: DUF1064 domain-containing protein [Candidatus Izemoplasmatales bacterium]|nr:DUF1064 domain-containing protein [Candidatus Izemoplasmatales bacterium]